MGYPLFYDFRYLIWVAPALILSLIAQLWMRSAYAKGQSIAASISGFMASRRILDAAGLHDVQIEEVPGELSDHYDPREKVLRLSSPVYHGRSLAAVGIAAHEAGHALQHAFGYAPLAIRNLAVPPASFGSGAGMLLLLLGLTTHRPALFWICLALFSAVAFFQLVNLPVAFNASNRAQALLVQEGIVHQFELAPVNNVLNAAALTYVAATLQSVL